MMAQIINTTKTIPSISFDERSLAVFNELKSQKIKVATMDLRIASIAISHNSTLLTRNRKDFSQIPNLPIEDWTQSQ